MQRSAVWLCALVVASGAWAEGGIDASWIWADVGNPAESAPAGKIWVRREIRVGEPSTCQIRVAVDDSFVLWVNGKKIGSGGSDKVHRFNLNGVVSEGINVFAFEVTNTGGPAGLLIDGVIRGQGGGENAIDGSPEWQVSTTAPTGAAWLEPKFAADGWMPAKVLGPHAESRWKDIPFTESYLDRYTVADGLVIDRVCEPDVAGSIIAMTWGNRGRLFVSEERGPIKAVVDENGDGIFDRATPYSDQMKNCQGLLVVGTDLYAVGDGPDGAGIYRLPDENQDDQADGIELVRRSRGGMGEHGPHTVVLGPDGQLYHCVGNHASVLAKRQEDSPYRNEVEGYLLEPKFEDGRGHASGIRAPGGTIWRFSPDGKEWRIETGGFRNEYDIAFNEEGELFTFDSDMEWDVGEPWYRPVRVNHCTPGAEFGWRSGAAKWPVENFDSLPAAANIGRGSPTGVVFYEHEQLPEKYRGSFLVCDWSMGRLISVPMEPAGASFDGSRFETIVTGNPLNVSDIEIAPDGSILLATGGRGTEGGIYRVRAVGTDATAVKAETLEDLLDLPQPSAAWAREMAGNLQAKLGDEWAPALEKMVREGSPERKIRALSLLSQLGPAPSLDLLVVASNDASPKVRGFAAWLLGYHADPKSAESLTKLLSDADPRVQRRACEAFVRSSQEAPVEPLLKILESPDRFLAFSGRLALERVPVDKWKDQVLSSSSSDRQLLLGMLALLRQKPPAISGNEVIERVADLWKRGTEQKFEALRLAQLAIINGADSSAGTQLGAMLLAQFPSGNRTLDMRMAELIAKLQVPGSAEKLVAALEAEKSQEMQVHLALVLRYLTEGWTTDLKSRYYIWYDGAKGLEGGHSFEPYLENIVSGTFPLWTPEERSAQIADWKKHPFAARLLLRRSASDKIADFVPLMTEIIQQSESDPGAPYAGEVYDLSLNLLGSSTDPASGELLRKLFDENPDRREKLAAKLAQNVKPENRPYLVRSLNFVGDSTLGFVLRGLARLNTKPEKPEEVRQVIIAGLKLGDNGGKAALDLLHKWTGAKAPSEDVAGSLVFYQKWFAETYPNEPPADLPKAESNEEKFTVAQIMDFIENNARGQQADIAHGKEIYTKAQCIKCHKFGSEGQGIGPDLTTLRKRFQKKEIVESVLYPSQVVSDQYRTVTVVTVDGLVQTGMLAAQQGQDAVVLWLNNGERAEFKADEIEEQKPSTKSLMPPGLFKDLTLEDIADLFAYLETSKENVEPGQAPVTSTAGGGK